MSGSNGSGTDKFDELLKETKAGNRMASWQLAVSLAALVPGVVAAAAQSGSAVVIVAFVLPMVLVTAFFFAYQSGSPGTGNWHNWIIARERLRLLDEYSEKNLATRAYHDGYLTVLRMHYQFALVEGRKELAEFLRQELERESGTASKST